MPRVYYSTVLDSSTVVIWNLIRDFGSYRWAGGQYEATIENGKAGDAIGAIRRVRTADGYLRQRLLAHSDLDYSYTYEFCSATEMRNYQATLRVTPVVDRDRSFVEWWARFDCAESDEARLTTWLLHDGFPVWLGGLAATLANSTAPVRQARPVAAQL